MREGVSLVEIYSFYQKIIAIEQNVDKTFTPRTEQIGYQIAKRVPSQI